METVKVTDMLDYYSDKCVKTQEKAPETPPAHQIGYVMGGDGRVATDAYIKQRSKSSYSDEWYSIYRSYLKWLGHNVLDCNAVAEAYYKSVTGESIDTKARYNFSGWCSVRSGDAPDRTLAGLPQMRGVAVFSGGESSKEITHVGFLYGKYGSGDRDWLVLEARGKDYGLVLTTLSSRPWAYWGVMDKYFEYEGEKEMQKTLKIESPLMRGEDIKSLQTALSALGYECGTADGICGAKTMAAIKEFCANHGVTQLPNTASVQVSVDSSVYSGNVAIK